MDAKRIELTDAEWMSIIDGEREGLPRCCGNISQLRDSLIGVARAGGKVNFWSQVEMYANWCFPEHDVPSAAMQKVLDQLGIVPNNDPHEPQVAEI